MRLEDHRQDWNAHARARLLAAGPKLPGPVVAYSLARRWVPRTLRAAVDGYWRDHPLRAERLARALAARSAAPAGWTWRIGGEGPAASFRVPPLPWRDGEPQPGRCVVCGQPVHRLGWHRDLWGAGTPNGRAAWHACCVTAWKLWNAPSDHRKLLSKVQGRRCALSGRRLLRTAHVDHRVPLFEVWRDRRDLPWPELLGFWGVPNLQVINSAVHVEKSVGETRGRARLRQEMAGAAS